MNDIFSKGLKTYSGQLQKISEKEERASQSAKDSGQLGVGVHEDCRISEVNIKDSRNVGFSTLDITFEKDGKIKRAFIDIPVTEIYNETPSGEKVLWAYNSAKRFLAALFNTSRLTSQSVQLLGTLITTGEFDITGMLVTIVVGFGVKPHSVKVPDPADPERSVIKIQLSQRDSATGKYINSFVKDASGLQDRIFKDFQSAEVVGVAKFGNKFGKFPNVYKYHTSNANEIPEGLHEMVDTVYEESISGPKIKEEPVQTPKEEVKEEEPATHTGDVSNEYQDFVWEE